MPFDSPIRRVGTLEDIADSALGHEFDALLLLNGHGGNRPLVASATQTIGDRQPDVEVLGLTYFELGAYFVDEIREIDIGGIAHGGELETSMMLHLYPQLVNEEKLEGTKWAVPYESAPEDLLDSGPLAVNLDIESATESGALGDPTVASAEKGKRMFEGFGDEMEAHLTEIHEQNT